MALKIDRNPRDRNLDLPPPEGTGKEDAAPQPDRRSWWMTLFLLCAILGAMLALSGENADRQAAAG